jgi:phosphoserine phosphatase
MSSRARFPLVFFDVDSTLVTIEGIDVLAGGDPQVVALTEAAMTGEIPIGEVYGRRLEIIRPSRADIESLGRRYVQSLTPGAAEVISALQEARVDVHLVTAGIEQAVLPLAAHLRLQPRAVHAVRLNFGGDGSFSGYDSSSPLARSGGKELVVRDVRARAKGRAAFIGDGATDLEAVPAVDLFIGFGGVTMRDRVRDASAIYITDRSLTAVLSHLLEDNGS